HLPDRHRLSFPAAGIGEGSGLRGLAAAPAGAGAQPDLGLARPWRAARRRLARRRRRDRAGDAGQELGGRAGGPRSPARADAGLADLAAISCSRNALGSIHTGGSWASAWAK